MAADALTAVVTGAASGIGRALAEALHAKGAHLEVPPGEWSRVSDVNVGGVVNGLRAFVRFDTGARAHLSCDGWSIPS